MRCELDNCKYSERAGNRIGHVRIGRTERQLHVIDFRNFREVLDDTGTALALVEFNATGNIYRWYDKVDQLGKNTKKALALAVGHGGAALLERRTK